MILSILAISISTLSPVAASRAFDDLEPCNGVFAAFDLDHPLEVALRGALLDEGVHRDCQLVAVPTSGCEWCVYIVRDEKASPRLMFRELRRQLSGEMSNLLSRTGHSIRPEFQRAALAKVKIEVDTLTVPLTSDTADVLVQAWWGMLGRVRYADGGFSGRDGTTYFLSQWMPGAIRSGWTWSPERGTRTAAIVQLAEGMRDLARAPTEARGELERTLAADARALLERLRELPGAAEGEDRDR
jgi:hypothetical protein